MVSEGLEMKRRHYAEIKVKLFRESCYLSLSQGRSTPYLSQLLLGKIAAGDLPQVTSPKVRQAHNTPHIHVRIEILSFTAVVCMLLEEALFCENGVWHN